MYPQTSSSENLPVTSFWGTERRTNRGGLRYFDAPTGRFPFGFEKQGFAVRDLKELHPRQGPRGLAFRNGKTPSPIGSSGAVPFAQSFSLPGARSALERCQGAIGPVVSGECFVLFRCRKKSFGPVYFPFMYQSGPWRTVCTTFSFLPRPKTQREAQPRVFVPPRNTIFRRVVPTGFFLPSVQPLPPKIADARSRPLITCSFPSRRGFKNSSELRGVFDYPRIIQLGRCRRRPCFVSPRSSTATANCVNRNRTINQALAFDRCERPHARRSRSTVNRGHERRHSSSGVAEGSGRPSSRSTPIP